MKKSKQLIIVSGVVITFCLVSVFTYWLNYGSDDIKIGTYVLSQNDIEEWSWLSLKEDKKFIFNRGIGISYQPEGNYYTKYNELYLEVDGTIQYIFVIKNNSLLLKDCNEDFLINKTWKYTRK